MKKNKGELLPYLANVNVRWGSFELDDLREMKFEEHEKERFGLKYGDIVMCEGGEPGRCAIWKEQKPNMMIQKALHRIRPFADVDGNFLFYSFLHKGKAGGFAPLFTGSTIKHLPKEKLAKVEVDVPPFQTQQRIASILSAYDDLIENNRRRIQLLEQAARLLYKEWFVHLRFPGHEHVKIKDGVPEGWEKKTLLGLAESVSYGFTASSSQEEVGPKFLRITDIVPPVLNWDEVPFCEATAQDIQHNRLEVGDVVVARTGATVGYAKRISYLDCQAVYASYLVRFRFPTQTTSFIAGVFMESDSYKDFVRNHAGGAAQPNANAKVLGSAELLIPMQILQEQFGETISAIFCQRDTLIRQNSRLNKARDLLLPRLMNGEVSV
jgi:type I restriction enzyme S subunit